MTTLLKTRTKEFRRAKIDTRSIDAQNNRFSVIACVYNVVDDYNTRFIEGCFDEYALERLPTFCWSHDWAEPIGHCIAARNGDVGNGQRGWILDMQLDVDPAVPRAMQAAYQINSGTLTDVSVGFCRTGSKEAEDEPGVTDITGAECDENSLVIVGAVPGAKVLMSRSGKQQYVDAETAGGIMTRLQQGQIDLHEALGELKAAAVEGEADDGEEDSNKDDSKEESPIEGTEEDGESAEEEELVDEDIDAALALVP